MIIYFSYTVLKQQWKTAQKIVRWHFTFRQAAKTTANFGARQRWSRMFINMITRKFNCHTHCFTHIIINSTSLSRTSITNTCRTRAFELTKLTTKDMLCVCRLREQPCYESREPRRTASQRAEFLMNYMTSACIYQIRKVKTTHNESKIKYLTNPIQLLKVLPLCPNSEDEKFIRGRCWTLWRSILASSAFVFSLHCIWSTLHINMRFHIRTKI